MDLNMQKMLKSFRADIVSKEQFDGLQERLVKLENCTAGGGDSKQLQNFHMQIDRLVPS